MGYQTDYIGYLQIEPPLGNREIELVNRIYLDQTQSGLRVADQHDGVIRELQAGAPRGWSNWTACPEGCCLSYDGGDKAKPGALLDHRPRQRGGGRTAVALAYQTEIDRFRDWVTDPSRRS